MTYQEVARKMADWYREHPNGWCQGSFHQGDRHCIRGLAMILFHSDDEWIALEKLYSRFPNHAPAQWNDKAGRTVDEVIAKLEEFANE